MKLLKACFLLSLSSSLAMLVYGREAAEGNDTRMKGDEDYGAILAAGEEQFSSEEFLYEDEYSSFEDVMMQDHSNLRGRNLQAANQPVCRAVSFTQRSINVCGGLTGITCTSAMTSPSYCSSQASYSCMCTGSNAAVPCGFCHLQTSNSVVCQMSGGSNTFTHPTLGRTICSCEYRNGVAQQTCLPVQSTPTTSRPTPRPTPRPTSRPTTRTTPNPASPPVTRLGNDALLGSSFRVGLP